MDRRETGAICLIGGALLKETMREKWRRSEGKGRAASVSVLGSRDPPERGDK